MIPLSRSLSLWLALACLLPDLAAQPRQPVEAQTRRAWEFQDGAITFNNDFPGARLSRIEQIGDAEFRILIQPENFPINNSAWYAFQVASTTPQTVTVRLAYEKGGHRYHPKISRDGRDWQPIEKAAFAFDRETGEATLKLRAGPEPLWVAAQEMITSRDLYEWMDRIADKPFVAKTVAGRSMLGQPIAQLTIGDFGSRRYVILLSRQHPPEVTGSMGLMAFVETVTGGTELAARFRRQFTTLVFPLINPDGVDQGHWRHNMGGVDLNRDWKEFKQPETRIVRDAILEKVKQPDARAFLLLDFHSTGNDMFYAQPDELKMIPAAFTRDWLGAIQTRFPEYTVRRNDSHNAGQNTSKAWGYETLGAPSITCEFGDNTPRDLIRRVAQGAAEEMMRLLLAEVEGAGAD